VPKAEFWQVCRVPSKTCVPGIESYDRLGLVEADQENKTRRARDEVVLEEGPEVEEEDEGAASGATQLLC